MMSRTQLCILEFSISERFILMAQHGNNWLLP